MRGAAAIFVAAACSGVPPGVTVPSAREFSDAATWTRTHLSAGAPAFSFVYGGAASSDLLPQWAASTETKPLDGARRQTTRTWTDPVSGLAVTCVIVEYSDFPVVEWTVHLENRGSSNTPIIESLQALAAPLPGELLHWMKGSMQAPDDYQPMEEPLPPGADLALAPAGGRPSDGVWPYFNLTTAGPGVILAVGWPGQWAARFTAEEGRQVRVTAGQELTHFVLHPGERVRTPLIALLFHEGDWARSQNLWRKWMIADNMPRPGGRLPAPLLAGASDPYTETMVRTSTTDQLRWLEDYDRRGLAVKLWWMDAGWYVNGLDWTIVGTWAPDPERFPAGLKPITDAVHRRGQRALLWFEPERVMPGTSLYQEAPGWRLGPEGETNLFDLGIPEAREWMTERIDSLIVSQGVDDYREDFNLPPLPYWRGKDAADRQGIAEIRHVEGHLAMWDELRRRHPSMLIDSCASGGRRSDLETLRRAVALLRSDFDAGYDIEAIQAENFGFALWHAYAAGWPMPVELIQAYGFRSTLSMLGVLAYDVRRDDYDYPKLKSLLTERERLVPYLWEDVYPLTAWSYDRSSWIAMQYNRPEKGDGFVQAFRRPDNGEPQRTYQLRGLDSQARYLVSDADGGPAQCIPGARLMERGLTVVTQAAPAGKVLMYSRAWCNPD